MNLSTKAKNVILCITCLFGNILLVLSEQIWGVPLDLEIIFITIASIAGGFMPGLMVAIFTTGFRCLFDTQSIYYAFVGMTLGITISYMIHRVGIRKPKKLWGISLGVATFGSLTQFYVMRVIRQETGDVFEGISRLFLSYFLGFLIAIFFMRLFHTQLGKWFKEIQYIEVDVEKHENKEYKKFSLHTKMISLGCLVFLAISILAMYISGPIYERALLKNYVELAENAIQLMHQEIEEDSIEGYLETKQENAEYLVTKNELIQYQNAMDWIRYLYVFQVQDKGYAVVFDLDTNGEKGKPLGSWFEFDASLKEVKSLLLSGEKIEPIIVKDKNEWLLTVFEPMYDSKGTCVAYAAVDVSIGEIATKNAVFMVKINSLILALVLLVFALVLSFLRSHHSPPVKKIKERKDYFVFDASGNRDEKIAQMRAMELEDDNEWKELYLSLNHTVDDITKYMREMERKSNIILEIRDGIIDNFSEIEQEQGVSFKVTKSSVVNYVYLTVKKMMEKEIYTKILTKEYVRNLIRSTPLYDIGKIKIPDNLWNKRDDLSSDERKRRREHTLEGKKIIEEMGITSAESSYLQMASDMASFHHEWWDGSGYPYGLRNYDIPLGARIVAVADMYINLVSGCNNQKAYSREQALELIMEKSKTQFDPLVVEAFVEAINEIKEKRE